MDKYISAQDVREYLGRAIWGAGQKIDRWVDEMPAADVRPVIHGEWIECDHVVVEHGFVEHYQKAAWCCSNCHRAFKKECLTEKNFCPKCGADMRQAAGEQCSPLQEEPEGGGEP